MGIINTKKQPNSGIKLAVREPKIEHDNNYWYLIGSLKKVHKKQPQHVELLVNGKNLNYRHAVYAKYINGRNCWQDAVSASKIVSINTPEPK